MKEKKKTIITEDHILVLLQAAQYGFKNKGVLTTSQIHTLCKKIRKLQIENFLNNTHHERRTKNQ